MSGFTKLFASIVNSTVWDMSCEAKVVWVTMLALADRDGIVDASVPGLAKAAGVPRAACEAALAAFMAPDPDSRTKDFEGRRIAEVDGGWRLLNHAKYREKESREQRKEKDRERKRVKRDEKKVLSADVRSGPEPSGLADQCPVSSALSQQAEAEADTKADPDDEAHARTHDPTLKICPLHLTEVADKTGIVADFVERYRVEPDAVREFVREFVTHWTIGGGAGRREANWPKKLRGHLKSTLENPKYRRQADGRETEAQMRFRLRNGPRQPCSIDHTTASDEEHLAIIGGTRG